MEMSMSQSLYQRWSLVLPLGETYADLPLVSLHRVRSRIHSLEASKGVKGNLIKQLINQNRIYREDTGRKWNCITAGGLDTAVNDLETDLKRSVNLGLVSVRDTIPASDYQALREVLMDQVDSQYFTIKKWFNENADELEYDTHGDIPWPIVQRLRRQLGVWSTERINPFGISIADVIDDVATESGIDPTKYKDAKEIWDALKGIRRG